MSDYEYDVNPRWYVLHTYTGYEKKVVDNITNLIASNNLENNIFEMQIPMEEEVRELASGKRKIVQKKKFPSYVFIKAILTKTIWFLITNIQGCASFCGPGGYPIPLKDEEVKRMGLEMVEVEDLDIKIGDTVKIIRGPFEGFSGEVTEINIERQKIKVNVMMFNNPTPIELDFFMVEKLA